MRSSSITSTRKKGAGKHHRVDVKLSSAGPDGTLDFFSDSFTLHLSLKKGRVSGSAIVSGDRHAAKLKLSPRNIWNLEYIHEKDAATMSVFAKVGQVTQTTNLFGISHKDESHDIRLAFSGGVGLNGYVAARTNNLTFGLRFTKGGATSVELKHKGKNHDLKIKYHQNGNYEIKIKVNVGGGRLSVAKKRTSMEAKASFAF